MLAADFRLAVRALVRRPGFTLAVALGLALDKAMPFTVVARGTTERVWGEAVSGGYFDLLRLPLARGRGFLPEEDAPPEGRLVAVVSDGYRRRVFGDGAVLNESLKINGKSFTIVGVAPPGFHGINLEIGMGAPPDLWLPFRALRQVSAERAELAEKPGVRWLRTRLEPRPGRASRAGAGGKARRNAPREPRRLGTIGCDSLGRDWAD
jgi:hypothetical protein